MFIEWPTARAQSDGVAITFVNKKGDPQLVPFRKFLGETIFRVSHHKRLLLGLLNFD
jgi:superfamily II DNA/RNA helicase